MDSPVPHPWVFAVVRGKRDPIYLGGEFVGAETCGRIKWVSTTEWHLAVRPNQPVEVFTKDAAGQYDRHSV